MRIMDHFGKDARRFSTRLYLRMSPAFSLVAVAAWHPMAKNENFGANISAPAEVNFTLGTALIDARAMRS